jgi:hypothetical protein
MAAVNGPSEVGVDRGLAVADAAVAVAVGCGTVVSVGAGGFVGAGFVAGAAGWVGGGCVGGTAVGLTSGAVVGTAAGAVAGAVGCGAAQATSAITNINARLRRIFMVNLLVEEKVDADRERQAHFKFKEMITNSARRLYRGFVPWFERNNF